MTAEVVKLGRPRESDDLARFLREMADRAEAGEFKSVYAVFTAPDGMYMGVQQGEKIDNLRLVGYLESMKFDLLRSGLADD